MLHKSIEDSLLKMQREAKEQRNLSSENKNKLLKALAQALLSQTTELLAANQLDLKNLPTETAPSFRDRLSLNPARIESMAESLRQVSDLPDPVGELIEEKILANGLKLKKVLAPLGTIFMIFESRPNVILEAFSLAFKSGNSIVFRGGSDSKQTAAVIYAMMSSVFKVQGFTVSFYGIQDYERSLVEQLLKRKDLIDVVVPRGGEKLIEFVQKTSLMPIIKNDRGLCHTYVDEDADLKMAVQIVNNAKTHRPGVCNSLETVLVHKNCASDFLTQLYQATDSAKLFWRVDSRSEKILHDKSRVQIAAPVDWDTEHLDLIINCKVVDSFDQALEHIAGHGSKHSEAIVTKSEAKARRFQSEVDAAAVYWNASTRFTDGFEFGLGGELGISTQKLHVRGPVGLRELTTARWLIDGTGQIRS